MALTKIQKTQPKTLVLSFFGKLKSLFVSSGGLAPVKGFTGPVRGFTAPVKGFTAPVRGFTLLEVLVAMSILSVALLALHQGFASNIYITSYTQGLWKAIRFANNETAIIERGPAPSVSVNEGEFEEDHAMAGFRWKKEVKNTSPIPGVTVRRISYELTWDEGGSARTYEAVIYVTP